jgi:hypothetical protein
MKIWVDKGDGKTRGGTDRRVGKRADCQWGTVKKVLGV